MFGRRKEPPAPPTVEKVGGKGHATPTRKEAQAAAKDRARKGSGKARPGASRKEQREARAEANARMRQALKTGDERYLPARDKGPVKRFVRDYVDSRLSFVEFLIVMLVLIIVLQLTGVRALQQFAAGLQSAVILLSIVDVALLIWKLGRELNRRFPNEDLRGWRLYAVTRAIQVRPLRMPKPQVRAREVLSDRY